MNRASENCRQSLTVPAWSTRESTREESEKGIEKNSGLKLNTVDEKHYISKKSNAKSTSL